MSETKALITGIDGQNGSSLDWQECVKCDTPYERPSEVEALIGDASKAQLGWSETTLGADLVNLMVDADLEMAATGRPTSLVS